MWNLDLVANLKQVSCLSYIDLIISMHLRLQAFHNLPNSNETFRIKYLSITFFLIPISQLINSIKYCYVIRQWLIVEFPSVLMMQILRLTKVFQLFQELFSVSKFFHSQIHHFNKHLLLFVSTLLSIFTKKMRIIFAYSLEWMQCYLKVEMFGL